MTLGIGSYTFGWAIGAPGHAPADPLGENGLLDKARDSGVKLVQIGDNLPLHTFATDRLDQLARRAAQEGIELQVGARRLTLERVQEYSAITRRLGGKLLRFIIDDSDYHPSPDEIAGVLRDSSNALEGLTLAIENHDRFPAAALRQFIEQAGDEKIGICLDTANSLGAGEGLGEVVPTLAPVTVNLHLKDFRIRRVQHLMGFEIAGCPAGQGMMRVPWLLDQFRPFDRCRSAILEQWTPPEPNLAEPFGRKQPGRQKACLT
jgi:sugar phosphate isomerase/epimerase